MAQQDIITSSNPFQRFPSELVGAICSLLPNSDIKNLRLTSRYLNDKSRLRLNRLFISPNERNLDVLRAVANHPTFRLGVEEIIWDDATLKPIQSYNGRVHYDSDEDEDEDEEDGGHDSDEDEEEYEEADSLAWYTGVCKADIKRAKYRMGEETPRPDILARQYQLDNSMSFQESYEYYKALEAQQQHLIASQADEEAFRYALKQFPRLRKVTVTPAAHGYLFEPLYETPMIRTFPNGFLYPIPRGWPVPEDGMAWAIPEPWNEASEEDKNKWRGFRIVTRILAEEQHNVVELAFENHQLGTGVNHTALDRECPEYNDLCAILKRPRFTKIQLSVLVGYLRDGEDAQDWDTYRNGFLRNALAGATEIEHVSFQSDYCENSSMYGGDMDCFVSLFDIFPVDHWSKLTHFGLSNIQVTQDDLVLFLTKLPTTLQSIELSFLGFLKDHGHYKGLLEDIHDKLDWRSRPMDARVGIQVKVFPPQSFYGRYICLDKEVCEYLYEEGPLPFELTRRGNGSTVIKGMGMQRDVFNPHWERPYDSHRVLRGLGY